MAALLGEKTDGEEGQGAGQQVGEEVGRLEGLALQKLAAEVMEKCFGLDGPGAPAPRGAGPSVRMIVVGDDDTGSADRLEKLAKLRRGGLLDDAAFESARQALEAGR